MIDERGFARTADAGDADQAAERDLHVDVFQVVLAATFELEAVFPDRAAADSAGRRWRIRRSGI